MYYACNFLFSFVVSGWHTLTVPSYGHTTLLCPVSCLHQFNQMSRPLSVANRGEVSLHYQVFLGLFSLSGSKFVGMPGAYRLVALPGNRPRIYILWEGRVVIWSSRVIFWHPMSHETRNWDRFRRGNWAVAEEVWTGKQMPGLYTGTRATGTRATGTNIYRTSWPGCIKVIVHEWVISGFRELCEAQPLHPFRASLPIQNHLQ